MGAMDSRHSKSFVVFAVACSVAAATEASLCGADGGQECQTLVTQMLQIGTQVLQELQPKPRGKGLPSSLAQVSASQTVPLRKIPRHSVNDFRNLLENRFISNLTLLLADLGPIIITNLSSRLMEWSPRSPACASGEVEIGAYSKPFLQAYASQAGPAELRRLNHVVQDAHNMSFSDMLNSMQRNMTVAEYAGYLANVSVPGRNPQHRPSQPHYPALDKEVEFFASLPFYAHDIPLGRFCPNNMAKWTPGSILGFETPFVARRARVFWGPGGSEAYPLHVNDDIGQGPLLKLVSVGIQRVAIFPQTEAGKLLPLNPTDADHPHARAIFRADALGSLADAMHFGEFAHASGWADEVKAGEALVFLGSDIHQFKNSLETFSTVFFEREGGR